MKGFQEFMVYPSRMDNILQRLDKIEERVFKEQAKETEFESQGRIVARIGGPKCREDVVC